MPMSRTQLLIRRATMLGKLVEHTRGCARCKHGLKRNLKRIHLRSLLGRRR